MNHENFEERLALVRAVLAKHDLKPGSIAPIDYDEKCPFPYNNFTYKVALATPSPGGFGNANAACTSVPLGDVSSLIVRLSNPNAEGINQANRVQNEVAALFLARRGQAPSVIPAVYDWHARSPDLENDMSWILMEFKTGVGLDQHFEALSETQKAAVIDQIADIFSVVQTAPLPQTVTQHGGLNVGDDGDIVSGEMTTLEGGPWPTYAAFLQTKFASRLKDADQSSALRGWKENGVRERIDAFLTSGLQKRLGDSGVDEMQRVLVHGDLTMNNILFDKDAVKITGLVDFDFAFIGHPYQEFLSSFSDMGENWEKVLMAKDILRPEVMEGIDTLKLVGRLEGLLSPFRLTHPVFLGRQTAEQIQQGRAKAETDLLACLAELGA